MTMLIMRALDKNFSNFFHGVAHKKTEPGRGSDQALSGRRRGAYRTRNVDPKALPQASSAFRSVRCENIPNIAPHIAAYISRMGMVYLRFAFGASTRMWAAKFHSTWLIDQHKSV